MNTLSTEYLMTSELDRNEKIAIMRLWNEEYPAAMAYSSLSAFENYLESLSQPQHILVKQNEQILGWSSKFDRDAKRWFVIILSSLLHKKRIGSNLLDKLKSEEIELNGWVIDHHMEKKNNNYLYNSPLGFYMKNGFELEPNQRLETSNLSAVKITWSRK
ncbi:N-acetyltransferase [Sphingobacterium multivorum]|jgi:hypothetical protein|uniref:N-acetyltransferase n=2 Tax=Sphingobacteriaceae TaxID=84566 RepID=UPI0028A986F2|nr:N-acetyltransferase [Sphingobacterium multivorum]